MQSFSYYSSMLSKLCCINLIATSKQIRTVVKLFQYLFLGNRFAIFLLSYNNLATTAKSQILIVS